MACALDQPGYGIPMINLNPANFTFKRMDRRARWNSSSGLTHPRRVPVRHIVGKRSDVSTAGEGDPGE